MTTVEDDQRRYFRSWRRIEAALDEAFGTERAADRAPDIAADNWRAEADRMKGERDRALAALKACRAQPDKAHRARLAEEDALSMPYAGVPWRIGLTVGRTVYAGDVLIGVFDTQALAARAVADHNATLS